MKTKLEQEIELFHARLRTNASYVYEVMEKYAPRLLQVLRCIQDEDCVTFHTVMKYIDGITDSTIRYHLARLAKWQFARILKPRRGSSGRAGSLPIEYQITDLGRCILQAEKRWGKGDA